MWQCALCTLVNVNERHLVCVACHTERNTEPDPPQLLACAPPRSPAARAPATQPQRVNATEVTTELCGWCAVTERIVPQTSELEYLCSKRCRDPTREIVQFRAVLTEDQHAGWEFGYVSRVDVQKLQESADRYLVKQWPHNPGDDGTWKQRFNHDCECEKECGLCIGIKPFELISQLPEKPDLTKGEFTSDPRWLPEGARVEVLWEVVQSVAQQGQQSVYDVDGAASEASWKKAEVIHTDTGSFHTGNDRAERKFTVVKLRYDDGDQRSNIVCGRTCVEAFGGTELWLVPSDPVLISMKVRLVVVKARVTQACSCEQLRAKLQRSDRIARDPVVLVWGRSAGFPAWPAQVLELLCKHNSAGCRGCTASIRWLQWPDDVSIDEKPVADLGLFADKFAYYDTHYSFASYCGEQRHIAAIVTALRLFKDSLLAGASWADVARKLKCDERVIDVLMPQQQVHDVGEQHEEAELSESTTDYSDDSNEDPDDGSDSDGAAAEASEGCSPIKRMKSTRVHASSLEADLHQVRAAFLQEIHDECVRQDFDFDKETLVCSAKHPRVAPEAAAAQGGTREHTFVDLFCSCGGLSLGLIQSGMTCIDACEKSAEVAAVHDAMTQFEQPLRPCKCKVQEVSAYVVGVKTRVGGYPNRGQADVVAGGPPCQCYSGLNRKRNGGEEDHRHLCSQQFLDVVEELEPRFVVWENVKGSMSAFWWRGRYIWPFLVVILKLVRLGYQVRPNLLTAAHYGAPCTRQRIVLLAAGKGEQLPAAPKCTHHIALPQRRGLLAWRKLFVHSTADLPAARTRIDAISDLPDPSTGAGCVEYTRAASEGFQTEMRERNQSLHGHQEASNKQESLFTARCAAQMDQPADTIPCKYSISWKCYYSQKKRLFTTRESGRFQSWPDRHHLGKTPFARQRNVGNMVPPMMAKAIGSTIMDALGRG